MRRRIVLITLFLTACVATAPPAPREGDQFQAETTVLAAYNVISGPAGRRDWDRFKDLFVPGARLIIVHADGKTESMTTDEYVTMSKPLFDQNGLFEHPVSTRFDQAGNIAHIFNAYESRHTSTDVAPFARGTKSIQLVKSGDQWRIATIVTEEEAVASKP